MRKLLYWALATATLFAASSSSLSQDSQEKSTSQSPIVLKQSPAAEAAMRESGCCSFLNRQNDLAHQVVKTYYFKYLKQPTEIQDVVNGLRTILEFQRVQPVPSLPGLVVRGSAEQIAAADKMIADIDQPRAATAASESYKLDYTLSEIENGKKVSSRSYAVVVKRGRDVHSAEYAKYRVGSRVPISTGPQVQYNDVGVNIDCRLYGADDDLTLDSTVEISGVATAQEAAGQPTIRQAKAVSIATLTPGKPLLLSSLEAADSPRRTDIEVTATRLK